MTKKQKQLYCQTCNEPIDEDVCCINCSCGACGSYIGNNESCLVCLTKRPTKESRQAEIKSFEPLIQIFSEDKYFVSQIKRTIANIERLIEIEEKQRGRRHEASKNKKTSA